MNEEWIMQHTAPGRFLQIRELIRCKDCKKRRTNMCLMRFGNYDWTTDSGFCPSGTTKEGDYTYEEN